MDGRRFFIVGPTASGKGRAAIEVALRIGGEVISVDSMKVYRGMDVGTAKPTAEKRRGVPFHLLDVRDPGETMSVAEFIRAAEAAEAEIRARGRVPIFAGGTALYVRGLTEGVFEGPPADRALRERLAAEAAERGPAALHARLREVDPPTAARLHPNDLRRVIRALEVFEKTGQPISALQREWTDFGGRIFDAREEAARAGRVLVGIEWPRALLDERIDERVDRMFARGFVEEARALLARPGGVGREADQALGYRELFRWLRAGGNEQDLPAVVDKIKRDTRRFARRQLTFFRHMRDIDWIAVGRETDAADLALRIVEKHELEEPI